MNAISPTSTPKAIGIAQRESENGLVRKSSKSKSKEHRHRRRRGHSTGDSANTNDKSKRHSSKKSKKSKKKKEPLASPAQVNSFDDDASLSEDSGKDMILKAQVTLPSKRDLTKTDETRSTHSSAGDKVFKVPIIQ